ncbi:general amidase [Auriscalpium vulgare]|uniref:General amidase n=1 Tax=Auriscalpium vulgare TaxID=40419 RepID=A0ACB8S6H9_9AGAM|nr:general amidase [Auriscalpium vulgare]
MSTWQEIAADKRARQTESIPKDWLIAKPPDDVLDVTTVPEDSGLLSDLELEITSVVDVSVLLNNLATGKWSSVAVVTAFAKRAIIAHQVTNCLTEIFIDKALERAAWLDEQLKTTGKVVGPLHGLPVSLKDQISLQGLETIMGYVSWVGRIAEKNAVLADILIDCGAVPYVRTNVPQTLMWPETYNLVFGRTVNPRNRTLTSGGSSGGEGALIAMHGSVLGVGSDIGGSIRIPAAMNGIYGLRPTCNRVPYSGAANSLEGQDSIRSVLGPLSSSLNGVKTFMKAVLSKKPWLLDPLVVRKPWSEEEYSLVDHGGGKKLCFAILWDNGIVKPHPPVKRALEMTKAALLKAGHEVVDWKSYKYAEIIECTRDIWTAAGLEDYQAVTSQLGEPILESMLGAEAEATAEYVGQESISAFRLFQIQKKLLALRKESLDLWQATQSQTSTGRPVDAIISPVAAHAPTPHGKYTYFRSAAYTLVFNALDYPACVFPVTAVDPQLDMPSPAHAFLSEDDKLMYELYDDPSTFKNAPVALQLVGRGLEEEAVVAMTEIVDAALKV